jgi:hypothetical protein
MALVTFKKSYDFLVNQVIDGAGLGTHDFMKYQIWAIKNTLISYPNNPWVVLWSSDATSAGAADYWTDWTKVNFHSGTNPHSWVVLDSFGGGQLLIDCKSSASTREDIITIKWSNEGLFVGPGTVNVAPVATDEHVMLNTVNWRPYVYDGDILPTQLHGIHSTDGEIDHIILTFNGTPFLYWGKQTVQCSVPNYDLKNIFFARTNNSLSTSRLSYGVHSEQQYWACKKNSSGDATGIFNCGLTVMVGETTGNDLGQIVTGPNSPSGKYQFYPIGMMSLTAGFEGRHGQLFDQWFVPSSLKTGFTLEEDYDSPTYELAVFANMALPCDGSVPQVS